MWSTHPPSSSPPFIDTMIEAQGRFTKLLREHGLVIEDAIAVVLIEHVAYVTPTVKEIPPKPKP